MSGQVSRIYGTVVDLVSVGGLEVEDSTTAEKNENAAWVRTGILAVC